MSAKKQIPAVPEGDLRAVSIQIELEPIETEDLPVSVIQVLPLNEVKVRDSRMDFQVNQLSVLSILSHFGDFAVDLAIDYDHGMYYRENMEAAGWGEKLWAVIPKDWADRIDPFIEQYDSERVSTMVSDDESMWGIFAFVRWTPDAAEKIRKREYRYISPVVFFDYRGNANYLWNASVVNQPAIDGMDALAASIMKPRQIEKDTIIQDPADASSSSAEKTPDTGDDFSADGSAGKGENDMKYLENLTTSLGLEALPEKEEDFDAEAFAAAAVAKVEVLVEKSNEAEALAADYERVNAEAEEAREALKVQTEKVEKFEAKAEELRIENERQTIAAAVADGRLAASQQDWARDNYPAFEALLPTLEETPAGPPQGENGEGSEETALSVDLDEDEKVAKIKAYAKKNDLSFTEAFKKLG